MKILFVTPASAGSRSGNRVTALRWAKIVRSLGHRATLATRYTSQPCDLLVALHARRSAASVSRFREFRPDAPIVVALTGTDLYQDLPDSTEANRSLELATRLITLQPHGIGFLPRSVQRKAVAIYQSAVAPKSRPQPLSRVLEVTVIGHLRQVKDPFRAAQAARRLPVDSRIRIVHIGSAMSEAMSQRAEKYSTSDPRYTWLGELPRWKTLRRLARSRLTVISSRLEGGSNVACEALAAGVPIVSTKISGLIGLLGEDYPGYFPVGDTARLASLMSRFESDSNFRKALRQSCREAAPLVSPRREAASWKQLLGELSQTS
jgi:putative glycosyltransferase (TIGR04348 family)